MIERLYNAIAEGTFGPLRLIEQDGELYVIGCGLSKCVHSREEAERFVDELVGEVREVLGGLDADLAMRIAPHESDAQVEQPPPEAGTGEPTEVVEPAASTCEPAAPAVRVEPRSDDPDLPAGSRVTMPTVTVRADQVDETLREIVSHMRACCAAAQNCPGRGGTGILRGR